MCTAVVGGSIHLAATSISAASNQSATAPKPNHRTDVRRKPLRRGALDVRLELQSRFRIRD